MKKIASRYIPAAGNFSTFPFFNLPIVQMKAWQLYLGQSAFVFVMGAFFWVLVRLLRALGLGANPLVQDTTRGLKKFATGTQSADAAEEIMSSVFQPKAKGD